MNMPLLYGSPTVSSTLSPTAKIDGVARELIILFQSDRDRILAFWIELVVFHLQAAHAVVFIDKNALRRGEELEAHFRLADFRLAFRKLVRQALEYLVCILADCGKAILDPSHLFGDPVHIHVGAHRANFFRIVLSLGRPTPYDRGDPLDFLIANQPMRDIDHHIAGANDSHMLAHVERPVAETRAVD